MMNFFKAAAVPFAACLGAIACASVASWGKGKVTDIAKRRKAEKAAAAPAPAAKPAE